MTHQIILLPSEGYWDWVQAAHDYALNFGVNLTSSPEIAAAYMAPNQVITFPAYPGGYTLQGDILDWFHKHHPEIRLDPISAFEPDTFRDVLGERVEKDDRFGQLQKPFYLLWPTDYAVVTQEFGANPQIYTRFGMPGHEGIDLRALPNTNIYSCAAGEVYLVQKNPKLHAYGIHVRIRHEGGYRTVYGHLAKALVSVGQRVEAGQVIGRADSTGASSASHLHLSLKKDFATARGETAYPKDIIDPTPFLVTPQAYPYKTSPSVKYGGGAFRVGVHARVGGPMEEEDFNAVVQGRFEAVKVDQKEWGSSIDRLYRMNPDLLIMARMSANFGRTPLSPAQFVSLIQRDMQKMYGKGVRHFELHTNPNLQFGGWGRSWADGREFAKWFNQVLEELRGKYPEGSFGFPGLSPGPPVTGQRGSMWEFLETAQGAVINADWIGVNSYWEGWRGLRAAEGGRVHEQYAARFSGKPLFITEFNNPSQQHSAEEKLSQYILFLNRLRGSPVRGAFYYCLSAVYGHTGVSLRSAGVGADLSRILSGLGSRAVRKPLTP